MSTNTAVGAVVGSAGAPFEQRDLVVDDPRDDEIVVQIVASGIGSEIAVDVLDTIVKSPRIVGVNQGRSVPRVVIPALVDHSQTG